MKLNFQLILEILLMLLFAFGIFSAFKMGTYSLLPFHLMMFFGFSYVVLASLNIGILAGRKADLTGFEKL